MKQSTQKILTTHTGSLPRPADLQQMLEARDRGDQVDPDITWAKLASMVEGAQIVSGRLWQAQ